MIKIIGVRFRNAGKVYYFDPKDFDIKAGGHVIVETARGVEYGTVIGPVRQVTDDKVVQPLKSVLRVATAEDDARAMRNREREREATKICKEKIRKHELEMKLIDTEYTFDGNKILFYFTADGRIDFRDLVKDLASAFKMRIELRQVGVRDETKLLGGLGICGRVLCCHSYLTDFVPVSIRMAKEQNLSLNPTKISGTCGRLMCCLKNEEETYEYLNARMPGQNDVVTTEDGRTGTVHTLNVLRQKVKVLFEENGEKSVEEFSVEELTFRPRRKKGKQAQAEEQDGKSKKEKKEKKKDKAPKTPQGEEQKQRNHADEEEPKQRHHADGEARQRRHADGEEPREPKQKHRGDGDEPREQRQRPRRERRAAGDGREPKNPEAVEQREAFEEMRTEQESGHSSEEREARRQRPQRQHRPRRNPGEEEAFEGNEERRAREPRAPRRPRPQPESPEAAAENQEEFAGENHPRRHRRPRRRPGREQAAGGESNEG